RAALRPLCAAMTGSALRREHSTTRLFGCGRRVRHVGCSHRRHPFLNGIQRITDAGDRPMVEHFRASVHSTNGGGEAFSALYATRIIVEVGVRAAHRAPIQYALIGRVVTREGTFERNRLPWARLEDPSDSVRMPIVVTRGATRPAVVRSL